MPKHLSAIVRRLLPGLPLLLASLLPPPQASASEKPPIIYQWTPEWNNGNYSKLSDAGWTYSRTGDYEEYVSPAMDLSSAAHPHLYQSINAYYNLGNERSTEIQVYYSTDGSRFTLAEPVSPTAMSVPLPRNTRKIKLQAKLPESGSQETKLNHDLAALLIGDWEDATSADSGFYHYAPDIENSDSEWTSEEAGYSKYLRISPQLDLSGASNPAIITDGPINELSVSYDGITFGNATKVDGYNIVFIPKDAVRIRMKTGHLTSAMITDIPYLSAIPGFKLENFKIHQGEQQQDNYRGLIISPPWSRAMEITCDIPAEFNGDILKFQSTHTGNDTYNNDFGGWFHPWNLNLTLVGGRWIDIASYAWESTKQFSANEAYQYYHISLPSNATGLYIYGASGNVYIDGRAGYHLRNLAFDGVAYGTEATVDSRSRQFAYDYDGDGTMEILQGDPGWISGKWCRIDDTGKLITVKSMRVPDYYISQLLDANNDGYVDLIDDGILYLGDSHGNVTPLKDIEKTGITGVDVTNDGRFDLLELKSGVPTRYVRLMDGDRGVMSHVDISSARTYDYSGGGIPSLADGMFVGGGSSAQPYSAFESVDVNGDGTPDLISAEENAAYFGLGDGSYVKAPGGGGMKMRDINGDGILDAISCDGTSATVTIINADGSTKEKKLLSGLHLPGKIWCYDFDKDGDVDILIPVDYKVTINRKDNVNGASYLVLFENDGKGSFKKHENFVEGTVFFYECIDMDADGYFEVLANYSTDTQSDGDDPKGYRSYKIKGMKVEAPQTLPESDKNLRWLADFNNSGTLDYPVIDTQDVYKTTYKWQKLNDKVNRRPNPPAKAPELSYDPSRGQLTVKWEHGSDAESSPCDLTYELRVSTAPGKGDFVAADALADGTRRNLLEGRMGYGTVRTFNIADWPAGKYYIDVQAIDPNRRGSRFSEAAVWKNDQISANFLMDYKNPLAVGDTCRVVATGSLAQGQRFEWETGDATVIGRRDDNSELSITFSRPGDKHVILRVLDSRGDILATSDQQLTVPVFVGREKKLMSEYGPLGGIHAAMDLNGDGCNEIVSGYIYTENRSTGIWESVKKIYNTNLPTATPKIFDLNHDGLADLTWFERGSAINLGDLDMEVSTTGPKATSGSYVDMDHDGIPEVIYSGNKSVKTLSESLEYTGEEYRLTKGSPAGELTSREGFSILNFVRDFDGDGLPDIPIWYYSRTYRTYDDVRQREESHPLLHAFINQGDGTYLLNTDMHLYDLSDEQIAALEQLVEENSYPKSHPGNYYSSNNIVDLDNDGKYDLLIPLYYKDTDRYEWRVIWNDGTQDTACSIIASPSAKYSCSVDIDNNGYRDIIIGCYDNSKEYDSYIVYTLPGRKFKVEPRIVGEIDYMPAPSVTGTIMFKNSKGEILANDGTLRLEVDNTAPHAPADVRVSETDRGIRIDWSAAVDAETPKVNMRYNVSVRRKGAEGEGAYLLSPMNGEVDFAPVPQPKDYMSTTCMLIPTAKIAKGDYVVRIQSIDMMNATSEFSAPVEFTVTRVAFGRVPATARVNTPVTVKTSALLTTPIDWNGGTVTASEGNSYTVAWSTPGIKTLRSGEAVASINVIMPIDGDFTLPATIRQLDKVNVTGTNLAMGRWEISTDGGRTFTRTADMQPEQISFNIVDDTHANLSLADSGTAILRHILSDECGEVEYRHQVNVTDYAGDPIDVVKIDPATGRLAIHLNERPADATGVNIYKETSTADTYMLITTVNAATGMFVDRSSTPEICPARYRATYVWSYGESYTPEAHQSLHAMINHGIGNDINLMWSKYEGKAIASYRILRGASESELAPLATVSGHTISYIDRNPSASEPYYAIEMIPAAASRSAVAASRSNVVSTADAHDITPATSVKISSESNRTLIDPSAPELQLNAMIMPSYATHRTVLWEIVSGDDIAVINDRGMLSLKPVGPSGSVTVKASATDGSGCYDMITINAISGIDEADADHTAPAELSCSPSPAITEVTIDGLPEDGARVIIFNLSGVICKMVDAGESRVTIPVENLAGGHYFVRAEGAGGVQKGRFIKL